MTTTIRIGATPDAFTGKGLYFDGESGMPQRATLTIDEAESAIVITVDGAERARWPLSDIRKLKDTSDPDMTVLRLSQESTARLVLTAEEDKQIAEVRATRLNWSPPVDGKGRLALWGAGAVGAVVAMIFFLIPFLADNLAGLLPASGKRALGETVFEDIRGALDRTGLNPTPICENPEGIAALEAMGTRLFPDEVTEDGLDVYVLDHDMVNAFALPGNIVVFMRGLIEEAESAEEVAAVYAHEVGHVVARDPSRIALRSAGSVGVLGLLLGDFAGGAVVLFLTNRMIQADYSQEAEAAADAFSHEVLLAAGIRPDAMARFFKRLRKEYGDVDGIVQHFLSHPSMADRIEAARQATPEDAIYSPVLTEDEWAALQSVCES
ncbi:MAG: M48 family metallopeptidase [Pseudomonadota bacterium]